MATTQPPDRHGFVAHTPDPTKYHYPDDRAVSKMRSGIRAVMIPRATRYGGSRGFTSGPGIANVEPADPDTGAGGITLDLAQVDATLSKAAYAKAVAMTDDPEEQILRAYQLMGMGQRNLPTQKLAAEPPEPPRENPLMPNEYVVPKSRPGGAQIVTENPLTPGTKKLPVRLHPQNVSVQREVGNDQPPFQANGHMAPDLQTVQMMAQMSQTMAELANAVASIQAPRHVELPSVPQRATADRIRKATPEPEEDDEEEEETELVDVWEKGEPQPVKKAAKAKPKAKPKELEEEKEIVAGGKISMIPKSKAIEIVKEGMASLSIPNLSVVAEKPKFRVEFDLGRLGKQSAWYHWVCQHGNGLFLIYDTRFEYGAQYSPPDLGPEQPITVRLPDHDKEYRVYSTDFVHPFGCFNIVNLIVAKDRPLAGSADEVLTPRIEEAMDGISDIPELM